MVPQFYSAHLVALGFLVRGTSGDNLLVYNW